jgi:hypothetical protein
MVTNGCTGLAQSDDLGMGCWVGVDDVAVPSSAHNLAVTHHDCAYRDFSGFESTLGAAEGFLHPDFVGVSFAWRRFAGDFSGLGAVSCRYFLSRHEWGLHSILAGSMLNAQECDDRANVRRNSGPRASADAV